MNDCAHENFAATVNVIRMTKGDAGPLHSYMAELRIKCADCGRKMQFRGLPTGLDTAGAAVSPDGLEARLGICPQGEELAFTDRIAAVIRPPEEPN